MKDTETYLHRTTGLVAECKQAVGGDMEVNNLRVPDTCWHVLYAGGRVPRVHTNADFERLYQKKEN